MGGRGQRGVLAAAMKDGDEGAAVKHTVDVIYLLMGRTHHTETLPFKFTLFQREPSIDLGRKAHIHATMWFIHERTRTNKKSKKTGAKQTCSNPFVSSLSNYTAQFHGG